LRRLYIAASWSNLGAIFAALGRHAEARTHHQEALRRWERSLGPTHPALAFALLGIGKSHLAEHDPEAALAPLERALALRSAGDIDAIYLSEAQHQLATALWAARPRERARARALVEHARRLLADDPEARVEVDQWLAEHLVP